MKMNSCSYLIVVFAAVTWSSCSKDKNTGSSSSGTPQPGQSQTANSEVYFKATINGTQVSWQQGNNKYSAGTSTSTGIADCNGNTFSATKFYFGSADDYDFLISLSRCTDFFWEDFDSNCEAALAWIGTVKTFPFVHDEDTEEGAYLIFKDPKTGISYSSAPGTASGSVTITDVSAPTYAPNKKYKYLLSGKIEGTLVDDNGNTVTIAGATFRIIAGKCP